MVNWTPELAAGLAVITASCPACGARVVTGAVAGAAPGAQSDDTTAARLCARCHGTAGSLRALIADPERIERTINYRDPVKVAADRRALHDRDRVAGVAAHLHIDPDLAARVADLVEEHFAGRTPTAGLSVLQ